MNIEALNCPNCGAGVASDSTQCEFCKTRLKTMACPSCLGLMFIGSEFCGRCGARAATANIIRGGTGGDCPRCNSKLSLLQIDNIELSECHNCGGMWAGVETFESICSRGEEQAAVLRYAGERKAFVTSPDEVKYVPCPDCGQLMNRSNFARSSGVIIDLCKRHGVWFDPDELPRIIGFIHEGGMQAAREKELIDIRDERSRLKDEQRKQAAMDRRFGTGNISDHDDDSWMSRFIRSFFE